ncbi:hypothetical protein BT93_J0511 [Corymbia citriodora subsp. variegata]|nr:hypothetical protein BT93_J0511 [Corymbia citriodora subsp. variegata]
MRDIISCFSEDSISFSNPSCSHPSKNAFISPSPLPSVQNAVTCVYRTILSKHKKQLLITISWFTAQTGHRDVLMSFDHDPSSSFRLGTNSGLFRKNRSQYRKVEHQSSEIEVFWDFSKAVYETGPEPVDGFYVLVTVDSELGLVLGDMATQEAISKKLKVCASGDRAKFSMVSRREHLSGDSMYSTKARFGMTGIVHDVLINHRDEREGQKDPVLYVYVDKKIVLRVKRLQWNFRGSQTIFVDGSAIDLLWNVHDWFFVPGTRCATFMFRTRNETSSAAIATTTDDSERFWLEEKLAMQEEEESHRSDFSLLICASKSA